MAALFISHSSKENDRAHALAAWLRGQGWESLFLDIDPDAGLAGGREWELQLYARLRQCRAVLVLCSANSYTSRWCFAEVTQARALGKSVLPLRIADGDVVPDILRELQVVDLQAADGWPRLARALSDILGPRDTLRWDGSRAPYPGLLAFDEADAAVYFGRDAEVRDAVALLNRLARVGGARMALVLGVSGSGKSSLVRAGMLPALRRDRRAWWIVEPFRPLRDPFAELARAVARTLPAGALADAERAALQAGTLAAADFAQQLQHWRDDAGAPDAIALLVIDQLEELIASDAPRAAAFTDWLLQAVDAAGGPLMVLSTLRSDQLGRLQTHALGTLPSADFGLGPLGRAGFAEIVEGPAQVAGLELDNDLVAELVADTGTDDALPLLAFALRELWERGRDDQRLTLAEYVDGLGRLTGALARAADAVLSARRLDDAQRGQLRAAFLRLVRLDDDGRCLRQRARWDDLPDAARALLEPFVKARLLVASERDGARTVEVAHEALFRGWNQLAAWIDEHRALLQAREAVRRAAADWRARDREASLLVHRGSRLDDATRLLDHPAIALSVDERDYIAACVTESSRQRNERERLLATAESELYVSLLMLAQQYVERGQYDLALAALDSCPPARRHWEWGYLMRLAHLELPVRWQVDEPAEADVPVPVPGTFDLHAWHWPAAGQPPQRVTLRARFDGPAFSADGRWRLDAEGPAPRQRLWLVPLPAGERVDLGLHEDYGVNAAFSPDGSLLAVTCGPLVRVWDCAAARMLLELRGHRSTAWGATFSPDGRRIVTCADDGSARIWDAASGRALATLTEHATWRYEPRPSGLAMSMYGNDRGAPWRRPGFSPNGTMLAAEAEPGGRSCVWEAWPWSAAQLPGADFNAAFAAFRDHEGRSSLQVLAHWQPASPAHDREVRRVTTADEFIEALAPSTIIEIATEAPLDLGAVMHAGHANAQWLPAHDGRTLTLRDLPWLTIRPAPGIARATIITPHAYAFVLHFERCDGLELHALTLGHEPERGGCDRGVLGLSDSTAVHLANCDLYGCGTEGLTAANVNWLLAEDLVVRDCTYGIATLDHCNFVHLRRARLAGNEEYWGLRLTRSRDVLLTNCEIRDNRCADEPLIDVQACRNLAFAGGTVAGNESRALGGVGNLRVEGVTFVGNRDRSGTAWKFP